MFLLCVGSAFYVRGFTCFISHKDKKLKFFCCQFTVDHNQGILFKAFRCKQCGGTIGRGMDPNKSSSKDKEKKISRKVVSVWRRRKSTRAGTAQGEKQGWSFNEGGGRRKQQPERAVHTVNGGACPFKDLPLTWQILYLYKCNNENSTRRQTSALIWPGVVSPVACDSSAFFFLLLLDEKQQCENGL